MSDLRNDNALKLVALTLAGSALARLMGDVTGCGLFLNRAYNQIAFLDKLPLPSAEPEPEAEPNPTPRRRKPA